MAKDAARTTAQILIETKSVLFQPDEPFTLTSGRKSPVYIDCRRLISFPEARGSLMAMMADQIRDAIPVDEIDVVAGGETAGIPFAAWIAERLARPMIYVRKEPKGFGRNARIEGVLRPDDWVILIEDLSTDGGSKLSFVEALREAGAVCSHTFVIFHYGIFPDGERKLEDAGVSLHALATWWDVLACAKQEGSFDSETLQEVETFLRAPETWIAPQTTAGQSQ
jgi:orotate phosphoribosyltransferase